MPIVNGKPSMFAQTPSAPAVQAGVPAGIQQAVTSTGIAQPGQPPADAAKQLLGNKTKLVAMPKPIGPSNDAPSPLGQRGLSADKKKVCKQSKCSHWKGGKCRCGRD